VGWSVDWDVAGCALSAVTEGINSSTWDTTRRIAIARDRADASFEQKKIYEGPRIMAANEVRFDSQSEWCLAVCRSRVIDFLSNLNRAHLSLPFQSERTHFMLVGSVQIKHGCTYPLSCSSEHLCHGLSSEQSNNFCFRLAYAFTRGLPNQDYFIWYHVFSLQIKMNSSRAICFLSNQNWVHPFAFISPGFSQFGDYHSFQTARIQLTRLAGREIKTISFTVNRPI
jgi:hypothetical protein